ncbi:response regulator [bacterium]|nr:response regulator [candidate division CSSED10-310 bacterium]
MLEIEKEGLDIMLVEDNQDDIILMQRAFSQNRIRNRVRIVRDGEEALDYIFHRGKYEDISDCPMPGLVILDLKLPRIDGVEVLKIIKSDKKLRTIPIIMLTTSRDERDIKLCYQLGVNSYIVKPTEFDTFAGIVGEVTNYWLQLNELPDVFRKTIQTR